MSTCSTSFLKLFLDYSIKVINLRIQRSHSLNSDKLNVDEIKLPNEKPNILQEANEPENGGAFSPPPSKAPIAHMDSEDDFLPSANGSKISTSRIKIFPESNKNGKMNFLITENDKELLFCAETAYEAIKESNKESQKLLQVFLFVFYN